MTARIFLTNVWAGSKFGKEISCEKSSLREDSGLFLPEFDYRRDEPFQQRFTPDGHRTVRFFDKKAGEIDRDLLLSRVNTLLTKFFGIFLNQNT